LVLPIGAAMLSLSSIATPVFDPLGANGATSGRHAWQELYALAPSGHAARQKK